MNKRHLVVVVSAAAGLLLLAFIYRSVHAKPMSEMQETLTSWSSGKAQMESSLSDAASVRRRLDELVSQSLGQDPQLAEHRLRTLLTDLCARATLDEYVISCKEPKGVGNPAAAENVREFSRDMRNTPDFVSQETVITASGSYESCMRAVALLEAQPWLARVDSLTLQPSGKERLLYDLTASVTTLVLPDLATESTGQDAFVHEPHEATMAELAQRNPFVVTPDPAPVVAQVDPEPTPRNPRPKPKPFDEWIVTGVMQTEDGGEVILSNAKTGASRSMTPGAEILGLRVSEVGVGFVTMMEGESGYRVALGQSLAERVALIE
ncbi:MAG: hypothetical protein ED559_06945 [Phycisphaera sp.]|nr:MAG: hypothetical protein ED559_06945 [Phycisphaera sp.]